MTGPLPIPNIFKSVLNLMYALVTTEAYPVTWAVREVLQDETMSYADAISELSARKVCHADVSDYRRYWRG